MEEPVCEQSGSVDLVVEWSGMEWNVICGSNNV